MDKSSRVTSAGSTVGHGAAMPPLVSLSPLIYTFFYSVLSTQSSVVLMSVSSSSLALAAANSRRMLRQRTGRGQVLLVGRAAAAIDAALRALDFHDRPVLIPANTCYIVLWAVLLSGNQPFLVDIDPLTGNISPETLDRSGVDQPAAIIPAHLYGIPAPMPALIEWARAHRAVVIEDAALALGASVDGRPAGSWGDLSVFSFGAGKIADAGAGGALLTDDSALAAEIERLLADAPLWDRHLQRLNRQWLELYWALHQYEAENPRLADLYPTLFNLYRPIVRCRLADWRDLRRELRVLDANLAKRREAAANFDQILSGAAVRLLPRPPDAALWRYPILVPPDQRESLLESLWSAHFFDATRWYPSLQLMRRALAPHLSVTAAPAADAFAAEIVNLPLADPPTVAQIVLDFFKK